MITGQAGPPIEIDWHWSDRHLGRGPSMAALDERSDESGDPTSAPLPVHSIRLGSGSSPGSPSVGGIGARGTGCAPAAVVSPVQLCEGCGRRGLSFAATSPVVRLERARALVTGRRRVRQIAPELRVPVGVRAIAVDGVTPPLALDPFAIATRTAPDMVQIEVAEDAGARDRRRPAAVVLPQHWRRTPMVGGAPTPCARSDGIHSAGVGSDDAPRSDCSERYHGAQAPASHCRSASAPGGRLLVDIARRRDHGTPDRRPRWRWCTARGHSCT